MINLFIRQPFTESSNDERIIVQSVLDLIKKIVLENGNINVITDFEAQTSDSFIIRFEQLTRKKFTPQEFRKYRLSLLDTADAIIHIRTGLSESSSFEIAYNIFKGKKAPILFCVWKNSPIKTTLLKDLDDLCDANYIEFSDFSDLESTIIDFLAKISS